MISVRKPKGPLERGCDSCGRIEGKDDHVPRLVLSVGEDDNRQSITVLCRRCALTLSVCLGSAIKEARK